MLDMQPAVDLESAKTDDDGHAVHGKRRSKHRGEGQGFC
jgi:hypothetical protein